MARVAFLLVLFHTPSLSIIICEFPRTDLTRRSSFKRWYLTSAGTAEKIQRTKYPLFCSLTHRDQTDSQRYPAGGLVDPGPRPIGPNLALTITSTLVFIRPGTEYCDWVWLGVCLRFRICGTAERGRGLRGRNSLCKVKRVTESTGTVTVLLHCDCCTVIIALLCPLDCDANSEYVLWQWCDMNSDHFWFLFELYQFLFLSDFLSIFASLRLLWYSAIMWWSDSSTARRIHHFYHFITSFCNSVVLSYTLHRGWTSLLLHMPHRWRAILAITQVEISISDRLVLQEQKGFEYFSRASCK